MHRPTSTGLDPGVAVAGRLVEEASGHSVGGAIVAIDGWPLARSSRDGSFVVRHARPTWASLVARGRGLGGEAKPAGGPLVVPLKPARRLTGVVRDAETKERLAGAVVTLYDEEWTARSSAVTDRRGRYAFGALAAGRYQAFAARVGYSASRADHSEPEAIDLRRSASGAREFRLIPRRRIVGRVQDEQGRPIADALVRPGAKGGPNVYAAPGPRGRGWPTAWTAPDGSFVLAAEDGWIRREPGVALTVLKRGYAAGRLEPAALEGAPLVVTLPRGVEITGRVTTSDGEPIPGASVDLVEGGHFGGVQAAPPEGSGDAGWTKTDTEGRFVTRVHPVAHHLIFRKGGFTPTTVRGHDPASGQTLDVVLEPAAEILGRILRSDGTGIPEVQLFAMGSQTMVPTFATTASDGRFVIGGLSPGRYELHFAKAGTGLSGTRNVTAPDPDLRIEPGPLGTIRGIVTDAWTHTPVERFSVELEPLTSAERFAFGGRHAPSIRGARGVFTFEEVPVGEVALTLRAEGFVSQRLPRVAVTTGVDVPPLEIALDHGSRIRGLVTAEDGVALSDVQVSAETEDGESVWAEADESGAYELQGVLPGPVKLEFRREGYLTARRTVETTDVTRADAALVRGLTVRGVVLADGVAVPEARVWAHSSVVNAESASGSTDEKGRFTLEGLAPGRYTIGTRTFDGGEAEIDDVDVESAGWLRLSVQRSETAVLSGWVTGLSEDDDIQALMVQARGEGGESEYASVDGTGWFRMEKAPCGAVTVWASATSSVGAERSTRAQELSLPPGTATETVLEFTEGLVVAGHVMREGAPVADVRVGFRGVGVSVLEASARTDGDGRYEVVGLEPGRYRVSAWARDVSYSAEHTVAGYDELDIDVTGAALSGVVLDAASGSPLAEVSVSLWRHGPGENVPDKSMTSDANGEFAARFLAEGSYRVLASMSGFGQETREVALRRGDAVEVVLELEPSEGLTLEVVDARDGRPLDATVVVRDMARRIVANRHSGVGTDGKLTVALAPGQYLLSTSADGYGTVTRPVAAPGTGLRVGLTPGGTLVLESERARHGRIRLVGSDGEEYVRCWCNGLADIDLEGRRTTVEHVTPGRYTLEVIDEAGMSTAALTVAIREGQTSRVALD